MYHDEPSHRPGQDPYAYAVETEERYGSMLRDYQERLQRLDRSDTSARTVQLVENCETAIKQYQGYLNSLISRKRSAGEPISYDYAEQNDVVFRQDSAPWSRDGKAYTKQDLQVLSRGNDCAAKLLIDAANERGESVFQAVQTDYRLVVLQAAAMKAKQHYVSAGMQQAFVDEVSTRLGFGHGLAGPQATSDVHSRSDDLER